ncbi:hypothetical protein ES708_12569 [subsurface metagenome]
MIKDILIDFGLPALLICCATFLIATGIDGEVKSILLLSAGWIFHSGYKHKKGV